VRFAVEDLGRPSICHCRMCQKAFGSFFGPFVTAKGLTWTRGAPKHFQSSNLVRRGFCGDCGTPLTYEWEGVSNVELAIGAFDDPASIRPVMQIGLETKLPWFGELDGLPGRPGAESAQADAMFGKVVSHPDHDTESWPNG
jgi:hypothetical protein